VDNDISAGGDNAAAGLDDGYLKVNNLLNSFGLPKDTVNLRIGQFELDLPITQARTINLTPLRRVQPGEHCAGGQRGVLYHRVASGHAEHFL
jgi:hypothetical protein